jgi:hypothetical protein
LRIVWDPDDPLAGWIDAVALEQRAGRCLLALLDEDVLHQRQGVQRPHADITLIGQVPGYEVQRSPPTRLALACVVDRLPHCRHRLDLAGAGVIVFDVRSSRLSITTSRSGGDRV